MKAITLHQPWATAIALGQKKYETRSWRPPESVIGERIAIHAANRPSEREFQAWLPEGTEYPLGAVVATATVRAYYLTHLLAPQLPISELAWGDYSPGRWAWQLIDVIRMPHPIPARGFHKVWTWINEPARRTALLGDLPKEYLAILRADPIYNQQEIRRIGVDPLFVCTEPPE